jgi:hypothetical protein
MRGKIKIEDFDRAYTIVVENTNAFSVPITLFGANQFLTAVNFGLPAGVNVSVSESSYQELLQETIVRPFIVGAMTITSTVPQLAQLNTVRYRDSNGVIQQCVLKTASYFSIYQYQSDVLEIYPIDVIVTGEMQTSFNLLGLTTDTIVLYVKKRINMNNLLRNHPVREEGSDLYPFFKSDIIL